MPTATSPRRRLTYDDFLLFPDDGLRHEIIDGEHYVTACPTSRHQLLLGRLFFEVELYLRAHPGSGQVFLSPLDVIFSKWDIVEPDLLFIAAGQEDILAEKNVQGAPALVVRVFRRQADGSLAAIAELARETVLTTPLLPGLEIRLNALFAH